MAHCSVATGLANVLFRHPTNFSAYNQKKKISIGCQNLFGRLECAWAPFQVLECTGSCLGEINIYHDPEVFHFSSLFLMISFFKKSLELPTWFALLTVLFLWVMEWSSGHDKYFFFPVLLSLYQLWRPEGCVRTWSLHAFCVTGNHKNLLDFLPVGFLGLCTPPVAI